jgi:D-tyrosyl-tRNA(Tyr) deacylase
MRLVVQRVKRASVEVEGRVCGQIGRGLVVLVGIEEVDGPEDAQWLAGKLVAMRIFADAEGKMNLDVKGVGGGVLLVSQFTLHASTRKGNRPSFIRAARPEVARPLFEAFGGLLEDAFGVPVQWGVFGADMQVELVNDGPVTLLMDSKVRD